MRFLLFLTFFLPLQRQISDGLLPENLLWIPQPPFTVAQDTSITIKAVTGLQFDLPRFAVAPGTKVTLLIQNTDDMAHNLVITQPGKRLDVVNAALALGAKGPEMNYVPRSPFVLWASPILNPEQSKTLTFTAPAKEGVYPYVCTYPGHGFIMYGAMYVTLNPLPPLKEDTNVSPNQMVEDAHHAQQPALHPYPITYPAVYRTFMPNCGPAAIAVGLPSEQSYCWDAGACRLRYAWSGGFVDNRAHWKGNGNALAEIIGTVYYRDKAAFPLRVGSAGKLPKTLFKGYVLLKRYPQFEYSIDGILVKELIKPLNSGTGLVREFVLSNPKKDIYFVTKVGDGVTYRSSTGAFVKGVLRIPAAKAAHFTITMTEKMGGLK